MTVKRFDQDEERELLIKAQQGDLMARRKLHIVFKGMLDKIVYQNLRGDPLNAPAVRIEAEKLLDKSIDSWDPNMPNKPSTYLHGNIQKKLQRYISERANPVRVIEHFSFNIGKYKEATRELSQKLERVPTDLELQSFMNTRYPGYNFSIKDIGRFKSDVRTTALSSNVVGKVDEGSPLTLGDLVFSSGGEDAMEDYLKDVKVQELVTKVHSLAEPYKTVVLHTYGLNGYAKLSLRDLALKLGVNKYKVQVLQKEALEMLKKDVSF